MLVPIKPLAVAKTRLRGAVEECLHADLVLAMARDTVAAALACPDVTTVAVVTGEPVVADAVAAQGATVVPEPAPVGGALNAALTHGATVVGDGWVAALPADLPALRPAELATALRAAHAAGRPGYVADAAGTGTVLLTAVAGTPLRPRFGPDSAQAHARGGAVPLVGDWPSLRRDVDSPDDLGLATALGLGAHTAAVLSGACRP